MHHVTHTRRNALKISLAMAGAKLPLFSIGKEGAPASGKVNMAYIGVGGSATGILDNFPGCNHIAMCDVDDRSSVRTRKSHPGVPFFKDYRRMFDKLGKEMDAVVVSTPNHTHFTAAMEAIERGKHVYVETPLAHDIWQVRTLQKAAAYHGVITQMGNKTHAKDGLLCLKEWYDAGICGEVREVVAWFSSIPDREKKTWRALNRFPPVKAPVPAGLDWDLWLGPAREREFADSYLDGSWRQFWELGNGVLGDMGCNMLDAPHWILGLDAPATVAAEESRYHKEIIADTSKVVYRFPARQERPPVKLTWYNGRMPAERAAYERRGIGMPKGHGIILIGDKHTMYLNAWNDHPRLLMPERQWLEFQPSLPEKSIPRVAGGPYEEWLNHIKGEGSVPESNFEYSARLTENVLLGTLAQRSGEKIEWDGDRITNNQSLNDLLRTPARKGWEYGAQYWKAG